MRFTATVKGGTGQEQFPIEARPEQTVGDIRQKLAAQGLELVGLDPVSIQPQPTSTTTTATTTLPRLGGFTPADVAQIAGGGIGTMLGGPALGAATALGARGLVGAANVPRSPGVGPTPLGQEVGGRALRETLRGVPSEVLGGVAAPAYRLGRGVVAPRTLPVLRSLADRVGLPAARRALAPEAQQEAAAVTRGGLATLRTAFGSVFRTRESGPIALRTGVRGLLRRLPDSTRAAVQQRVLDETGVNLERLTTDRLGKLVRTDPQAVVTMLRLIERESGVSAEPLVRTVRQTVVSRAVSKSLRPPPKGVAFPEAFRGGVLDPDTLLTELAAVRKMLGDDGMRAVFGTEGVKALNELSRTLGGAHRAVEFARAGLPQRVVPPATGPVRLLPLAAAMMVGLGLGGRTGEVL